MKLWAIAFLVLCFIACLSLIAGILRALKDPDLSKLAELDVNRLTVEDVAGLLRTTRWAARQICETCVRRGEFERNGDDYKLVKQTT